MKTQIEFSSEIDELKINLEKNIVCTSKEISAFIFYVGALQTRILCNLKFNPEITKNIDPKKIRFYGYEEIYDDIISIISAKKDTLETVIEILDSSIDKKFNFFKTTKILVENVLLLVSDNDSENVTEKVIQKIPEKVSESIPKNVSESIPESVFKSVRQKTIKKELKSPLELLNESDVDFESFFDN